MENQLFCRTSSNQAVKGKKIKVKTEASGDNSNDKENESEIETTETKPKIHELPKAQEIPEKVTCKAQDHAMT